MSSKVQGEQNFKLRKYGMGASPPGRNFQPMKASGSKSRPIREEDAKKSDTVVCCIPRVI
jgi:hypothetical protein